MEKRKIGERLGRVLAELKATKQIESFQQLAKDCKISASAISEMTSGRNHISQGFMNCLVEMFNVNRDYIMKGIGDPFSSTKFSLSGRPIFLYDEFRYSVDSNLFEDAKVENASGMIYDADYADCSFGMIVSTDHLYPQYSPGDKLILKQVSDLQVVQYGKPYVILTAEMLLFRTVHKSDIPNNWCLRAGTKKYDDIELPVEKVKALYQVKGNLHRVS